MKTETLVSTSPANVAGRGPRARLRHALGSPAAKLLGQAVVIGLCLYLLGRQLAGHWQEMRALEMRARVLDLVLPFAVMLLGLLCQPVAIWVYARRHPRAIRYGDSAYAYFRSQPAKYLPGGVWVVPGRLLLLRGFGYGTRLPSEGLAFEIVVQVASCGAVSAVCLFVTRTAFPLQAPLAWAILAGCLAASALFVFLPRLTARLPAELAGVKLRTVTGPISPAARLFDLVLSVTIYTVMWLVFGLSFLLLLPAVGLPVSRLDPLAATAAFSLSWLAGFAAPFSPGGIGVREGVMAVLLAPWLPAPYPVILALLSRVIWLAAEFALFVSAGAFRRGSPSPPVAGSAE